MLLSKRKKIEMRMETSVKVFVLFYFVWGKLGCLIAFCVCHFFWLLRVFTRKYSFLFGTLSSLYVMNESREAILLS